MPVDIPDVSGEYRELSRKMKAAVSRGLRRIGQTVCSRAKWYAPKSPTRAMLRRGFLEGTEVLTLKILTGGCAGIELTVTDS